MTTRRSKSYFFTGAYGILGKLFKKGNQPDQSTYEKLTDSLPFINDVGDTAKTTEQGLVKKSTSLQYLAGTDNDPSGFALYPLPSLVQTQFASYRTSTLQDIIDATKGTNNVIHGTSVPTASVVIKTYYLHTTTGDWYVNNGGGTTWTLIEDVSTLFGSTEITSGSGTPTASVVLKTYYYDTATGDVYVNAGGGTTWTIVYQPIRIVYASSAPPSPSAPTYCVRTDEGKIYYSAGGVAYSLVFDIGLIFGKTDVVFASGTATGRKYVPTLYCDTDNGNWYYNAGGGSTSWTGIFDPSSIFGTTNVLYGQAVPSSAVDVKTYYLRQTTGDWYVNVGGGSTWTLILSASTVFGTTNIEFGSGAASGARNVATYYYDILTGNWYSNVGGGGATWTSAFVASSLFYTAADNDARLNILETELTDTFLLSATGTTTTIIFPTLDALQGIEIEKIVTFLKDKYTNGAASTNTVTIYYAGSSPDTIFTIENSAFMNDLICEQATKDTSTEAKRKIYLGPTNGLIKAVQTGTNHMTGSTAHMQLKIYYRIVNFNA